MQSNRKEVCFHKAVAMFADMRCAVAFSEGGNARGKRLFHILFAVGFNGNGYNRSILTRNPCRLSSSAATNAMEVFPTPSTPEKVTTGPFRRITRFWTRTSLTLSRLFLLREAMASRSLLLAIKSTGLSRPPVRSHPSSSELTRESGDTTSYIRPFDNPGQY